MEVFAIGFETLLKISTFIFSPDRQFLCQGEDTGVSLVSNASLEKDKSATFVEKTTQQVAGHLPTSGCFHIKLESPQGLLWVKVTLDQLVQRLQETQRTWSQAKQQPTSEETSSQHEDVLMCTKHSPGPKETIHIQSFHCRFYQKQVIIFRPVSFINDQVGVRHRWRPTGRLRTSGETAVYLFVVLDVRPLGHGVHARLLAGPPRRLRQELHHFAFRKTLRIP